MASDELRKQILEQLRSGQTSSKVIAQQLGVSAQVVMGVKSHWTLGKYGDLPRTTPDENTSVPSWTYLLLSERGEVYLGATTSLRKRLRQHNAPDNDGFTRGRRWHLLAVRRFSARQQAFAYEGQLKRSMHLKMEWKIASIERAWRIVARHGYSFVPDNWNPIF
ncbi:MAG: GIY-YIG nuclease family protein [Gammaproteobacteria bacterium]